MYFETGLAFEHLANDARITAFTPTVGLRVFPLQYLDLGARFAIGIGGCRVCDETLVVPAMGFGAAGTIPIGRVRIRAGIVVPITFTRQGDDVYADPWLNGDFGARVSIGDGLVIAGGQVEIGLLERPRIAVVGQVGFRLGP